MSGYAGGDMENPSYENVSSGQTKHAEAIQLEFDPKIIDYETLLKLFFKFHDPTTPNRQGADVGTQYRSVIFYHNDKQRAAAEKTKETFSMSGNFNDPIITEIVPFKKFFKAEEYHQDFYANNPDYGYCRLIIDPKIQKLLEGFKEYLKDDFK